MRIKVTTWRGKVSTLECQKVSARKIKYNGKVYSGTKKLLDELYPAKWDMTKGTPGVGVFDYGNAWKQYQVIV